MSKLRVDNFAISLDGNGEAVDQDRPARERGVVTTCGPVRGPCHGYPFLPPLCLHRSEHRRSPSAVAWSSRAAASDPLPRRTIGCRVGRRTLA
jgi:hypothetical protein